MEVAWLLFVDLEAQPRIEVGRCDGGATVGGEMRMNDESEVKGKEKSSLCKWREEMLVETRQPAATTCACVGRKEQRTITTTPTIKRCVLALVCLPSLRSNALML